MNIVLLVFVCCILVLNFEVDVLDENIGYIFVFVKF